MPISPLLSEEMTSAVAVIKGEIGQETGQRIMAKSDSQTLAQAVKAAHSIEESIVDPPKEEPPAESDEETAEATPTEDKPVKTAPQAATAEAAASA
jgi:hypothetical protein